MRNPIIRRPLAVLLLALALAFPGWPSQTANASLSDIQGSWAQDSIEALLHQGVMGGYPDRTFKPNDPITRGEFAKVIATAFGLPPAHGASMPRDAEGHWAAEAIRSLTAADVVEGYPDRTFRPNRPISRAESATILARLLQVADVEGFAASTGPTFSDVPANHWAFSASEAAVRLNLLPAYLRETLEPDQAITRAEAAWMVHQTMRMGRDAGQVSAVNAPAGIFTIRTESDRVRDFRHNAATLVFRNELPSSLADLEVGDEVYVVADRFGNPRWVLAEGSQRGNDLGNQLAGFLREVLTPEDVQHIVNGNWEALADTARYTLYAQMLEVGATEAEAEAVLHQNWDALGWAARARLADAIALNLNVSQELAAAVVSQDWEAVREKAQLEAAQHLINQLLRAMEADA